jgi:hypothetical protein
VLTQLLVRLVEDNQDRTLQQQQQQYSVPAAAVHLAGKLQHV